MKKLLVFIFWITCLDAYAQRLSFGLEYEVYPFYYITHIQSFESKNSGNQYELLESFAIEGTQDTTSVGNVRVSGESDNSRGEGFSIGIATGIHKKKWAIRTGLNWSYEAFNLGLKLQGNALDTFQVVSRRSSIKIPLRYQHSLLFVKNKKSPINFLVLEAGINYVIPLGNSRQIPFLLKNGVRLRIDNETLIQDTKSLLDFYNTPFEIILGLGFMGLGRGQLMLRDKIYFNQVDSGWASFHNFGIVYSGDILGRRLLRKRKKLYESSN